MFESSCGCLGGHPKRSEQVGTDRNAKIAKVRRRFLAIPPKTPKFVGVFWRFHPKRQSSWGFFGDSTQNAKVRGGFLAILPKTPKFVGVFWRFHPKRQSSQEFFGDSNPTSHHISEISCV